MNEYRLSLGRVGELVRGMTETGTGLGCELAGCWLRLHTSALGQGWKSF